MLWEPGSLPHPDVLIGEVCAFPSEAVSAEAALVLCSRLLSLVPASVSIPLHLHSSLCYSAMSLVRKPAHFLFFLGYF